MCKKFQLKGCIYEPGSGIPLNWRDMRSKFGYKLLYAKNARKMLAFLGAL